MMSSSMPSLAYFSLSWSAIGLSSVSAASRSVFDFLRSQQEFSILLRMHSRKSFCTITVFVHFCFIHVSFHLSFLSFSEVFIIPAAYADYWRFSFENPWTSPKPLPCSLKIFSMYTQLKPNVCFACLRSASVGAEQTSPGCLAPLGSLPRHKKRNGSVSVPFHTACGIPQNTSYHPEFLYPDNKKSAKRLPCSDMVSLTLHTILDNVCLRSWLPTPEPTPPAFMTYTIHISLPDSRYA